MVTIVITQINVDVVTIVLKQKIR